MFTTRSKAVTGWILAVALLAAGTAAVVRAQSTKPAPKAQPLASPPGQPGLAPRDLVDRLAKQRLNVLRQVRDDHYRLYLGGEVNLAVILDSQRRYIEAVLSYCDRPEERLSALRVHLNTATQLERAAWEIYRTEHSTRADVVLAEAARIEVALRLLEAETGVRPSIRRMQGLKPAGDDQIRKALDRLDSDQAGRPDATGLLQGIGVIPLPPPAQTPPPPPTGGAGQKP
jgi:hypothetical protein